MDSRINSSMMEIPAELLEKLHWNNDEELQYDIYKDILVIQKHTIKENKNVLKLIELTPASVLTGKAEKPPVSIAEFVQGTLNKNEETTKKEVNPNVNKLNTLQQDIKVQTKPEHKEEQKVIKSKVQEKISNIEKPKKTKSSNSKTVIEFMVNTKFKRCARCNEYADMGFRVDNKFLCSACAKKDFKEYLEENKRSE